VFNGVVSGNETLFTEVKLAPIQATIIVGAHGLKIVRPSQQGTRMFASRWRDASLRESIALLDRYFSAVARSFGDRVRCALSGGYDSRLILAFFAPPWHQAQPVRLWPGSEREMCSWQQRSRAKRASSSTSSTRTTWPIHPS